MTAQPANGIATVNDNGTPDDSSDDTVTYIPNTDFSGTDTFQYEICDAVPNCDVASVLVTVRENIVGAPVPQAADDTATTDQGLAVDVDVLANDTGVPVIGTLTVTAQPANGTATVNDNGTPEDPSDDSVAYTPQAGFSGNDSFAYEICDDAPNCSTATVTVTVQGTTEVTVPQAADDTYETEENTGGIVAVLDNDPDVPTSGTLTISQQPASGTVTVNDNGTPDDPSDDTVTYIPNTDFSGTDSFQYEICDAVPNCDVASVLVTVRENIVGAPVPQAADDTATTDQGLAVDVDVLANDTGVPVIGTLTVTAQPANGTATVNDNGTPEDPSDDSVAYTPQAGFSGNDSFAYEICDDAPNCSTATVTVTVQGTTEVTVPQAADDTYETEENTGGIVAVLDNDSGVPTSGTLTIVRQPANGNTVVNENGTPNDPSDDTVTYTPDSGFSGGDSFEYEICDVEPNCGRATVIVAVEVPIEQIISIPVPAATDDTATTGQNAAIDIDVLGNDTDVPTAGSLIFTTQPENGTITINENGTPDNPSDDNVTYAPNAGFSGTDSLPTKFVIQFLTAAKPT